MNRLLPTRFLIYCGWCLEILICITQHLNSSLRHLTIFNLLILNLDFFKDIGATNLAKRHRAPYESKRKIIKPTLDLYCVDSEHQFHVTCGVDSSIVFILIDFNACLYS